MNENWKELMELLEGDPLFAGQAALLQELEQKQAAREVSISVLGQFKRGKSSLINAMLGEELLPVGIIPLTTVVTELRFGPRFRGQVCFADGSIREIGPEELRGYCSEQENSGNHKNVRVVRLWTPGHPFGEGVVLVDTPGVGSVYRNNTDATFDYLIHSDAVLFLLSVDSPVSRTEQEFLIKVREYAPKFYFAVNKADTVSDEDLRTFLTFCEKVVGETLERPVTMTAVSAKTGAGVPELTASLRESLNASHDGLVDRSVAQKLELVLRQVEAKLELARRSAALPGEELEEKLERLEGQTRSLAAFRDTLEVLARHHTGRLVGEVQQELQVKAEALKVKTESLCEALAEELASLSRSDFRETFRSRLDSALKEELSQLNKEGTELLSRGYGRVTELLAGKTAEAEQCLSDFMRREFGLDYPVERQEFTVDRRSDFFLQVGLKSLPRFRVEAFDRLAPRKAADARFCRECLRQAEEDIDCNFSNMIYNYRYKMQESLRPLCRELGERAEKTAEEMERLLKLLLDRRDRAEESRREEEQRCEIIRRAVEALSGEV